MKSLINICEGLLDDDFDIHDDDVMSGVKNWPKFIDRISEFGAPKQERISGTLFLVWPGTGLMEALTKGIETDLNKTISRKAASDACATGNNTILSIFMGARSAHPKWSAPIYIGNTGGAFLHFDVQGGNTTMRWGRSMTNVLISSHPQNWKFRKIPKECFGIIKSTLNIQ